MAGASIVRDARGGNMSQGGDEAPPHPIRDSIDALMGDIAQLRGEVAWLQHAREALRAE